VYDRERRDQNQEVRDPASARPRVIEGQVLNTSGSRVLERLPHGTRIVALEDHRDKK
jgi:hypothetical protein